MAFLIHTESDFPAAGELLSHWLPAADTAMGTLLGTRRRGDVHVVLSSTEQHAHRFPAERREVSSLVTPEELEEATAASQDAEKVLRERYAAAFYAHGVTVRARPGDAFPAAIPTGSDVIALDVPTITAVAGRLGVSPDALLVRVATHELSHVRRQHAATGRRVRVHAFHGEGDAQRDAWEVLATLIDAADLAPLARPARRAQVLLAEQQPSAYRNFGSLSPDRSPLSPLPPEPRRWLLRPRRRLLPLTRHAIVEIAILTSGERPALADELVLADSDLLIPGWRTVGVAKSPRAPHWQEARLQESAAAGDGSVTWLHLQRPSPLAAVDLASRPEHQLPKTRDGEPRLLSPAEMGLLDDLIATRDATALGDVAARIRLDRERQWEGLEAVLLETGQTLPPRPDFDPYREP